MKKLLELKKLKLGYGSEEIMSIDSLSLNKNEVTGLLGPSGCGKSSLLDAIICQPMSPSYWQEGKVLLNGVILTKSMAKKYIANVPQKARLYTGTILENFFDGIPLKKNIDKIKKQQLVQKFFTALDLWKQFEPILDDLVIKHSIGTHKLILLAKSIIRKPQLLLLDEVLSDISIKEENKIINLIKRLKKYTTIFLITHNKEEAKEMCDSIALVSGGVLHEHTPIEQFFVTPQSTIGIEFLKSGSAWYTNPNITERKDDELTLFRRFSSMCEFYWIINKKIGGMQKPGLTSDIEDNLKTMKLLGVHVLVTLQQKTIDPSLLNKYGITGVHFPIVDMDIPDLDEVYQLFQKLQTYIKDNKSIVYHCKAGMGRTGTMLACHLLWIEKISSIQSIGKVRQINHKYIQTDEQLEFVKQFDFFFEQK